MSNKLDTAATLSDDAETVRVRHLHEDAAVKRNAPPPPPGGGFDPYSNSSARPAAGKPRRTLDDMRKLSEEIKKSRQGG